MAGVTVFVDDAVRGHFPNVCAYTGEPADKRVRVRTEVGGTSPLAFLLVFFGPIGWLLLFLFWGRTEQLDVLVPVSLETRDRWKRLRTQRWLAVGAVAVTFVVAWQFNWGSTLPWYLVGAAVVWAVYAQARLHLGGIDVHLDASRRWVTLVGVSNEFARAVVARQDAQPERR